MENNDLVARAGLASERIVQVRVAYHARALSWAVMTRSAHNEKIYTRRTQLF
jgi:hypothetical protein